MGAAREALFLTQVELHDNYYNRNVVLRLRRPGVTFWESSVVLFRRKGPPSSQKPVAQRG